MNRFVLLIISCCFLQSTVTAQRLEKFSDNKLEFYKQLETYMTASKRKVMEKTVEEFGGHFQSGFDAAQQDTIISTCNKMLKLKMSASPYFKNYLLSLTQIKNLSNHKGRFYEWHEVIHSMMKDYSKKKKTIDKYLQFSNNFFQFYALKYSNTGGVNWNALTDSVQIGYNNKQPTIDIAKLNLFATRGLSLIHI